jgi:mRNA interferase MazF
MTEFRQGDIVIASFPFSTQKGSKVRPCLILARCDTPEDYLASYISSSRFPSAFPATIMIEKGIRDFEVTGLVTTSYVRADKISMLHTSVIGGKIGEMPSTLVAQVKSALRTLLEL